MTNKEKFIEVFGEGLQRQYITRSWWEQEYVPPTLDVTPKMGHWITLKDEWGDINEAVCSCCDANGNHKWHYCPNCGAKMVEPQESEE